MTIRIEVSPIVIRTNFAGKPYKCKNELLYAIRNQGFFQNGNNFFKKVSPDRRIYDKSIPVGINFEKHRKKVECVKFKSGPRKGKVKETKIVKEGGWIAYIYIFNQVPNIKVKQHARHFEILS